MKKIRTNPDDNSLFEFQDIAESARREPDGRVLLRAASCSPGFTSAEAEAEAVVTDAELSGALLGAGKRLIIEGGGLPDSELLAIYLKKVREAKLLIEKNGSFPAWLLPVIKRFSLPAPRRGIDF